MKKFDEVKKYLKNNKHKWLVTGCAGFIGSNITEFLLNHDQEVVGLDNFSTGYQKNLDDIQSVVGDKWKNFSFHEKDLINLEDCFEASKGVEYIIHQGALGSVPRSIEAPLNSHNSNVNGQLNILLAAKENNVKNVVFASSSSVYGDSPTLPKVEAEIGEQLSPYAVTKHVNELYGKVFYKTYGVRNLGIRYFNVFGKRQDPNGAYAAVIPKWVSAMVHNEDIYINGDGKTSRDFCYIENVIQMNILGALTEEEKAFGQIFNCACGDKTSLNELFDVIKTELSKNNSSLETKEAIYRDFRKGDIKHSLANISKGNELLGYEPTHTFQQGIVETLDWYVANS